MKELAKVTELWRYPVKSMGGERLQEAIILPQGLAGDRCWALRDSEQKEIRNAKRWPALLDYHARYVGAVPEEACFDDAVPAVEIACPDGTLLSSLQPDINTQLQQKLDKPAQLAALRPASDTAHYRLAKARDAESFEQEMAMQPGEALPDFSAAAPGIMSQLADHVTPPGSYIDAFPLHLLSEQSLAFLREQGNVDAVVQRFRPNILVEAEGEPASLLETQWLGRRLQIGSAVLRIDSKTVRCSMPGRGQHWAGLGEESAMARQMVAHTERFLGVNILVETPGRIKLGDSVQLLTD